MTPASNDARAISRASIITLLAAIWLFISPWVFGVYGNVNALNAWLAGALIAFFALIRMTRPNETGLSWANAFLGIWIFVSPWVLGYANEAGRLVSSLFVGTVVFCAAFIGANYRRTHYDPNATL